MSTIEEKIKTLNKEINHLKKELECKEKELILLKQNVKNEENRYSEKFSANEVEKYCRQIILPQIGIEGQQKLNKSKVLVIGVGGLGCPATQYLAAAGIGTLGLIDSDCVSKSNLHRQILFDEFDLNLSKVEVASQKLLRMNTDLNCIPIKAKLTRFNSEDIIKDYDIVLDCTDNIPTRYLVNDICMLLKKPLIAGNAIKFDGQLLVCIPGKTPCYRCLFPTPPSVECIGSCNQDGVLGAVPGVIGVLQALEAVKIICNISDPETNKKLTLFDGENLRFRHLNIRTPNPNCPSCGENNTFTLSSLPDYEEWCGMASQEVIAKYPPEVILPSDLRKTVKEFVAMKEEKSNYIILDVRPKVEYEMCRLPNSINIPCNELCSIVYKHKSIEKILQDNEVDFAGSKFSGITDKKRSPVFVLCRCGNDSQKAVKLMKENLNSENIEIFDLAGGLYAWNEFIDKSFPLY